MPNGILENEKVKLIKQWHKWCCHSETKASTLELKFNQLTFEELIYCIFYKEIEETASRKELEMESNVDVDVVYKNEEIADLDTIRDDVDLDSCSEESLEVQNILSNHQQKSNVQHYSKEANTQERNVTDFDKKHEQGSNLQEKLKTVNVQNQEKSVSLFVPPLPMPRTVFLSKLANEAELPNEVKTLFF